jgi:hypothetical protein
MAKKELNEDLLTGGSLSTEEKDKSAKKAEKSAEKAKKAAEKAAKQREKINAKKADIKKELDALKEQKAAETDEEKIKELDAKIKKLADKYSSVGVSGNGLAPRTKKAIKAVICVVLVVALICTYVATGLVRKGFVASLGIPAQYFTAATITNGENKIRVKVSTYNYYFAQSYNSLKSTQESYSQYGLNLADYNMDVDFDKPFSRQTTKNDDDKEVTWAEYMNDEVLEAIESTYTYYLEAVAANDGKEPEITEDQQKELDDTLKSYRDSAHNYGYTLSGYLVKAMGKGVTEHVFRQEATRSYIASNYKTSLAEKSAETEVTADQIKTYANEHKDDYKSVDIRFFEASNEDDAKAFVKALNSDASNFSELAAKYASSDYYKRAYAAEKGYTVLYGATKDVLKNKGLAIATHDDDDENKFSGLDKLFKAKKGDVVQYSTSVVYVLSPAKLSDMKTVTVRHILVAPETDEESTAATDATKEQWAAAQKKAQSILDDFNKGKKNEDAFAALVKDNTDDEGSASNGGLYENVVPGQMVDPFSAWIFDSSRKAGDTGIVQTDYGYHILYFVSKGDETVWEHNITDTLASENSETKQTALEEEYELKVNWFGSRYFEKDVDIDN